MIFLFFWKEAGTDSLEEMAAMTRHNTENAQSAARLRQEAAAVIENAKTSMEQLNRSMKEIASAGAFSSVSEKSGRVGSFIEEIAAASNELSQGIGQINRAVSEMDEIVQNWQIPCIRGPENGLRTGKRRSSAAVRIFRPISSTEKCFDSHLIFLYIPFVYATMQEEIK